VAREFAAMVSGFAPGADAPHPAPAEPGAPTADLTRREREVLSCLARGEATEAIAQRLFVSPRTVRNHVANILDKLDVHSRLEAVTFAMRQGLV